MLCRVAATCTIQTVCNSAFSSDVVIPFELVTGHIVFKAKVNNSRPLSFVLDTGASPTIIQLDRAKELGLRLHGEVGTGGAGSGVRRKGAFVKDAIFTIPEVAGFSQPVTLALPLANLAPAFGQDVDGIIGTEFIKNFVLEINYEARLIKLHDKDRFIYSGPGETIPIQFNPDEHPIVEAEVTPLGSHPIKGEFMLDTGAGQALTLFSPIVAKHHLLGPNLKTIKAMGGAGAGGQVSGQIGRVSELKIGRFQISNPITLFSEDKAGSFANPSLVGNLGGQILSRFRMFLDYGHRKVTFEPSAAFAEPFDRAFSGLVVRAEGADYRTFRISQLLENSPASEAGLAKGDVIVAIDGTPAAEFTLTRLLEMFERPVTYKLTVSRGRQTLQIALTPRRLV
jgi:membrane-associated protease RseP (regulator of RpoE activity)